MPQKLKVDALFKKAGCGSKTTKLGHYQKWASFFLIWTMNTGGYFFYGLFFYEKIPKYQCIFEKDADTFNDNNWVTCIPA